MNSFGNLLYRVGILAEAKTSPFAGTHPSFGGITKSMSTRGMSSAPYDTVKFLATFLSGLDIISDDEERSVLKAQGFKGKQLALLEIIKGKSREIVANSARIEEEMPAELENYINRSTLNRGRDMMPNAKVEGGSGGRRDKYGAQAAELAVKRKAAGEAKQQTLALKAAARGEEADVQSAVDVLVNTLDDADREVVDRADVAAGIGFKGAEDVKLDFDDIDINIGVIKDRDTLVDKLVKFFNKQPNFTAEKTRRGVNVEGPSGSFGTSVQDAEDMIISLVMRARPDIDEAQIVVDLHSDKAVSEDEEYGSSMTEDEEGGGNVYQGEVETVWYGDDGEEVDGVVYYTATKNPETGEIDIQLTGGDVTGDNPASKVDEDYIEFTIANPQYNQDYIADARADAEGRFGSMTEDEEDGGPFDRDDDYGPDIARARERDKRRRERNIIRDMGISDEPYNREDDDDDEEYDAGEADLDGGGVQPWEKRLAKRRGFKNVPPVTESYTSIYIAEQTRKDSYNTTKAEVGLTFKEKYKPKTSYQLDELRRYGL